MNRIIKFRARNNIDWIYCDAILEDWAILNTVGGMVKINKDTVGQFTGLHDKNGKEIYEGDIIKVKYRKGFKLGQPIYEEFIAKVIYDSKYASYVIENCKPKTLIHECENLGDYEDIEVIGNIYENSDLLKGADNIE